MWRRMLEPDYIIQSEPEEDMPLTRWLRPVLLSQLHASPQPHGTSPVKGLRDSAVRDLTLPASLPPAGFWH